MDFAPVYPNVARLMCDTDELSSLIPTPVIATYSDLISSQHVLADLEGVFPNSEVVLIDRGLGDPTGLSSVCDTERGAFTPAHAPGWFDRQAAKGIKDLTVYASLDNYPRVDSHMGDRHGRFYRWIAWWNHIEVPQDPDATVQFANAAMLGAHMDLSIIHNPRWHARTRQGAPAPATGWPGEGS